MMLEEERTLRELWTKQGVAIERQNEVIRQVQALAQGGIHFVDPIHGSKRKEA